MERYAFDDVLTGAHVVCRYPDTTAEVEPGTYKRAAESVFFPGCSLINYMMPLVKPVADLLEQAGAIDGVSLLCCGKILSYEPDGASARAAFEEDFRAHVKVAGIKRFVAACPNCVKALRDLLAADPGTADIEVAPLSRVLADLGYRIDPQVAQGMAETMLGAALDHPARFAVHDSCPDRETGEFAASVRELMGEGLLVEQEHHGPRSLCCGSLARAAGNDAAADKLAQTNGREAVEAGADVIVTPCASCVWQFTTAQRELPAIHYLELLFDWRAAWDLNAFMKLRFLFDVEDATDFSENRAFVALESERGAMATSAPVRERRRANCHFCGYLCAFIATVEDGRLVDLEPDPTRYPYDARILAGCRRWRMNLDMIDAPDRVNYPLKRIGDRGSDEWERVSWDDAIAEIASRLRALADEHGPETLASMIGGPHTSFWPLHRFMNLFGSPNNMGIGQICWNPRIWMDVLTFGWTVEADVTPGVTGCFIVWGTNPAQSDNSAFWQAIISFSKSDATLIAIDPRRTQVAALADIWVAIRPGTDCSFALGLLNVIIEEDLIDRDFVEEWCSGFDELAEHVRAYTPEVVAETCGVDPEEVRLVARSFARSPASAIVSGRGIDQVGRNVAPTHRAICCLRAVTGNVDKPGACVLAEASDFVPEFDLEMTDFLAPEHKARCLNTPYTPLQCYDGFAYVRTLTERHGRTLPERYLTSAHPDLVLRAMETGDPYPVRALIVEATNPLLTYADTHRVFRALMSLDLIVVLDYYLSPTAQIADFVLPAAGAVERSNFQAHGGVANIAYGGAKAVEPYYERKCDYDVFRALGLALGQGDAWSDETFEDACATTLEPCGMSFEEYCATGIYAGPALFFKHELPLPGCDESRGFATETGKIELASKALDRLGGPRLPEPSAPITMCSDKTRAKGAHLALITGSRKQPYNASMYFNNPSFRKRSPYPVAEMSPATAERLGLADGDVVVLATDKGEACFVLKTRTMRDDLVSADYGWWHPEGRRGLPDLGGIWDSNVNCLTSCSVAEGEEMIGTWSYNAIDCVVWKTDEPIGFTDHDLSV